MRRRDFLGLSGVALTAAAWPLADRDWCALAQGTQRPRLSMPPLLDTRKTGKLSLVAQTGQTSFAGGPPNLTAGYNSGFMGPTIVMQNGALDARVENRLNEPVTSHWHGLLVPGHHDGGPHTPVEPGKAWADMMQLDQQPTTAWYHSHTHGATARHVYAGLAGVIHHTDGRDDDRGLPSTYGVDDLTLVIQDKRFDDALSGTTAISILFRGKSMFISNVGDSRAIVISSVGDRLVAKPLSVDQTPYRKVQTWT
jgi:FtsP/CotA-like multicopper oxidase with cupredoxin domain